MTRRVALSAGHSNVKGQDMGAVGVFFIEGEETVNLRNKLIEEFNYRNVVVNKDDNSNVTYQTVSLFKKYFGKKDIVVDLHFNASDNKLATGCEVLIPADYSDFEYELASTIASTISKTLGIVNRGVKTELQSARKKLLWMTIPAENILIEVCFITNAKDSSEYLSKRSMLVSDLVEVLTAYKNK